MFSIPSTLNRNLCSRPSVARHFESRLLLPYASPGCMPGLALASFGHTGCSGSQMSDELNNAISSTPLTCTRMPAASPFWASSCRVTPERCAGHEVQQGDVRTDPNAAGNHRKSMMQAVEADYIDLYWVHVWDQITPVDEVMRGLDDRVRRKVLYVGISDARSHSMSCPPALLVRMADRLKSRM
jgi:hypothetical protein